MISRTGVPPSACLKAITIRSSESLDFPIRLVLGRLHRWLSGQPERCFIPLVILDQKTGGRAHLVDLFSSEPDDSRIKPWQTLRTHRNEKISRCQLLLTSVWNPKLDLTSDLQTFTSLTEGGGLRAQSNIRVQYEVLEDFFLALTLESEYDNKSTSQTTNTKTDNTSAFSVGWSW